MAGSRVAKIELKANAKGVEAGTRAASRSLRAFQREQERMSKRAADNDARRAAFRQKHWGNGGAQAAGDKSAGLAHSAVMGLGAAAGFDIASSLGEAAKSVFDVEKELTRLGIDANLSGAQVGGLRDQLMQVSNATGVSRLELVKAAHAYQILTGDARGAMESTKDFADVAIAAGAAPQEIAEAAASMRQNLNLDPKDFRKGFDVLLNLGHKGALELRDFAGEMSGIAPQFKQFGDSSSINQLTELGAAMETVKLNFASASETATGLRAAMTQISKTKVAARLANAGVDVWKIDPKTKEHVKRDFFDIIADIKKKIPDQKVLADILGGRQESFRAITAMLEHYDSMVKLKAEAANSDQVSVDSHKYLESSSGRISVAWERTKNAIASAITPERIEAFAGMMERAAKFAGDAAGYINHLTGGDSKETSVGAAVSDINAEAHKSPEAEQAMIEQAQRDLAMDPNSALAQARGKEYGGFANLQAADRKFLDSEDPKSKTVHAPIYSMEQVGGFARVVAQELAKVLNKPIVVQADANAIAKTANNAPINRGAHR